MPVHDTLEASMPNKTWVAGAAAIAAAGVLGADAAQAQQSVTLSAGQFAVKGFDSRIDRDVLLENLDVFAFRLDDFNGASVGGSWNLALGDHFEASLGLGYYRRTVPSVYYDYLDVGGNEIAQDFSLRIVPGTATLRFLPFGDTPVQPYVGGGIGVYNWRYAEFGKFIDFSDFDRRGSFGTFTRSLRGAGNRCGRHRPGRRSVSVRQPALLRPGDSVPRRERGGRRRQRLPRGGDRPRRTHHAGDLPGRFLTTSGGSTGGARRPLI